MYSKRLTMSDKAIGCARFESTKSADLMRNYVADSGFECPVSTLVRKVGIYPLCRDLTYFYVSNSVKSVQGDARELRSVPTSSTF